MKKQSELEKIWPDFALSEDIEMLSDYSEADIQQNLEKFFSLVNNAGYKSLKKWNGNIIFEFLDMMAAVAEGSNNEAIRAEFVKKYNIISTFLEFASKQNLMSMTYKNIKNLLDDFVSQTPLINPGNHENRPLLDDGQPDYSIMSGSIKQSQPSLPEWRAATSNDISKYTVDWVEAYTSSPEWEKRTKGVTKDIVSTSISALSEKVYDVYRKTPRSWTKKAIQDILMTYFVSNIDFTAEEYTLVVPALTELLDFVTDKGWLRIEIVERYKRYLAGAESQMIELAKDPNNFGPAKRALISMREQGVDLNTKEEVQKYMDQVNAKNGVDISKIKAKKTSVDYDSLSPKQLAIMVKEFDTDKEQSYLDELHKNDDGSKIWSKQKAIEMHEFGVQYGIKLKMNAEKYKIPASIGTSAIIGIASEMFDAMYAQKLDTPEQWQVSAWQDYSSWLREVHDDDAYYVISTVLKALAMILNDDKILSKKVSDGIIDALNGRVVSMADFQLIKGKLRKKKNDK